MCVFTYQQFRFVMFFMLGEVLHHCGMARIRLDIFSCIIISDITFKKCLLCQLVDKESPLPNYVNELTQTVQRRNPIQEVCEAGLFFRWGEIDPRTANGVKGDRFHARVNILHNQEEIRLGILHTFHIQTST
jgi:hypothetical protein